MRDSLRRVLFLFEVVITYISIIADFQTTYNMKMNIFRKKFAKYAPPISQRGVHLFVDLPIYSVSIRYKIIGDKS